MFSALLPPICATCGGPTASRRSLLCVRCEAGMPWLDRPCCKRCALPLPCGSACPARRQAFSRAWAAAEHAGPARALVAALKFRGAVGLADAMGAEMAHRAPPEMLGAAVLVPVPADPWRGPPSLVNCDRFVVHGDHVFSPDDVFTGSVIVQ